MIGTLKRLLKRPFKTGKTVPKKIWDPWTAWADLTAPELCLVLLPFWDLPIHVLRPFKSSYPF